MKILIMHTFGLGDMIMFTPALETIQKNHPHAQVDFAILQNSSSAVIKESSYISNIYTFEMTFASLFVLIKKIRPEHYDIILFTTGIQYWKSLLFLLTSTAKMKIIEYTKMHLSLFKEIKQDKDQHFVYRNLNIIKNFCPLQVDNISPKFYLKNMPASNKKYIGIHPGCNALFKNKRWEVEKYITLIEKLQKEYVHYPIKVFIGPDEKEEGLALAICCKEIEVIENLSLLEVAGHISECLLFINNDSGLGHISSCFDNEIITIKTTSSNANFNQTAIFSNKLHIIDMHTATNQDEVSKVFSVVRKVLP